VPIQNKTLLHERINSLDNLMLSNYNNPLLSSRNNNSNNNLLYNTVASENKSNNINSFYENSHIINYHSEKNIFSENNLNHNNDFKNDVKLSRNFSNFINSRFTNLKSEFDSIKDLNMNLYENKNDIKNQNLFEEKNPFKRNKTKHKQNLKPLDLNFFNLKIMRNNKWGYENNNKLKDFEENKYIRFFKPNRNNHLKDFNMSLKGKLPRKRKIFKNYE